MDSVKTRAGIMPVQSEQQFQIKTSEVEEYLQDKLDALIAAANTQGHNYDEVKLMLISSTGLSKKFCPFMIFLPTAVLEGSRKKKHEGDQLSIFDVDDDGDGPCKLKRLFFEFLAPYAYNTNDGKAFKSQEMRNILGISYKTGENLNRYRMPKKLNVNKGNDQFVVMVIDPVRMFHDMVTDDNDKRAFKVIINGVTRIDNKEVSYVFTKEPQKKQKNGKSFNDTIAAELNAKLKG